MSRARDLGSLINSTVAGKNFVINGGMDIAQRGTTLNGVQGYNLDRWIVNGYGTSTNYSVSQLLVSGIIPGIRWYQRIASTTTNVQNFFMSQSFETNEVIRFAGQTVTLSFYYRMPTNNFTGSWGVQTLYSTGTDANLHYPAASTTITADSLSNTVYWTRFTKTFTVPISATSFSIALNSTNNVVNAALFDITGVQLEIGSVATPFSRAGGTIQGELAACQRYFERMAATSIDSTFGMGVAYLSTSPIIHIQWQVPKRIVPSISFAGTWEVVGGNSVIGLTSPNLGANSTTVFACQMGGTSSGLTQGQAQLLRAGIDAPYIDISAEL
jgi:hypothetical protein